MRAVGSKWAREGAQRHATGAGNMRGRGGVARTRSSVKMPYVNLFDNNGVPLFLRRINHFIYFIFLFFIFYYIVFIFPILL